jgi:hypothetical protein
MYLNTSVHYFIMHFNTITAHQYVKLDRCEIITVVLLKSYIFRDSVLCWWVSTA